MDNSSNAVSLAEYLGYESVELVSTLEGGKTYVMDALKVYPQNDNKDKVSLTAEVGDIKTNTFEDGSIHYYTIELFEELNGKKTYIDYLEYEA